PLTSPPFPYTTLFRSAREHAREAFVLGVRRQHARRRDVYRDDQLGAEGAGRVEGDVRDHRAVDVEPAADLVRREVARQRARGEEDRKSTRLNSSHVSI